MNKRQVRSRHPHPAMKWTLLVGFVAVLILGAPSKVAASMPTVKPPTGPSNGGYFTGTYTFETYIYCNSGLNFQSSYSNSLEGTHTFNFDAGADGSLLVRIDGGGDLILYSCGDPTPSALTASYTVSRDTVPPSVNISSPADGSSTTSSQIDVAVSAGDSTSGIGSVMINGQSASFSGGLWHAVTGLAVGSNNINAIAADRAGHSASSQISVNRQPGASPPPPPPPTSGGTSRANPTVSHPTPQPITEVPAPAQQEQSPVTPQPTSTPMPTASLKPIPSSSPAPSTSHTPKSNTIPTFVKSAFKAGLVLFVLALLGWLISLRSVRHRIWTSANTERIRLEPYLFRLRVILRGIAHDQPRQRHLSHHRHTGKLTAHHHTSYPALVFLILCTALISGAVSFGSRAADSTMSLTVLGPAPTDPAYISAPSDGDVVSTQIIQVKGTCPIGLAVEIYRDGGFAGSGYCDANGLFSVSVSLNSGPNTLIARDVDGLGQYGPDSNPVTVTYNAPAPTPSPSTAPTPTISPLPPTPAPQASSGPATSKKTVYPTRPGSPLPQGQPFSLDSDQHYLQGVAPGTSILWQLKIISGTAPFKITWNWGDGSRDIVSVVDRQITSPSHTYSDPGFYKVTVTAQDAAGHSALLQMLAVVNGSTIPGGTKSKPDIGFLLPVWPVLAGMMLLVVCYWLGEHTYKDQHPTLRPQT